MRKLSTFFDSFSGSVANPFRAICLKTLVPFVSCNNVDVTDGQAAILVKLVKFRTSVQFFVSEMKQTKHHNKNNE
jgi:hypothetical protein